MSLRATIFKSMIFIFCPNHPTEGKGKYLQQCNYRKPAPGMFLAAAEKHQLDMNSSIMIGDSERDIIAGKAAGVGENILHPKNKGFDPEWIEAWLAKLATQT